MRPFLLRLFAPNSTRGRAFTFTCSSPAEAAERIARYAEGWGVSVMVLDWEVVGRPT